MGTSPLRLGTLGKDTWGDDLRSDVIVFPGKGAFDVESRMFSLCSSNSDRTPNSLSSIGEALESGTEIRISWLKVQAGWGENTGGSEGEVGWEMMLGPPASWLLVKCDVAQLHLDPSDRHGGNEEVGRHAIQTFLLNCKEMRRA